MRDCIHDYGRSSFLSISSICVLLFLHTQGPYSFVTSGASMRRVRPFCRLWITIILFSLQRADAQDARGITVGAPKAFDNRTLNLMLERLNAQLAGINVVDQTTLAKAIGAVQGSRITDTARSLTLQGLPTPS